MTTGKRYSVSKRRVREGKTNYKTRLNLLKGRSTRLVIRKSLKHIIIQAVVYEPAGDKVLMTVKSTELLKMGWKHSAGNIPSAYLTGLLAGKRMSELKMGNVILDLGLQNPTKGSRIFAALKGVLDAGVKIPHNESVIPKEDRLSGKHIAAYNKKSSSIENEFKSMKEKING